MKNFKGMEKADTEEARAPGLSSPLPLSASGTGEDLPSQGPGLGVLRGREQGLETVVGSCFTTEGHESDKGIPEGAVEPGLKPRSPDSLSAASLALSRFVYCKSQLCG